MPTEGDKKDINPTDNTEIRKALLFTEKLLAAERQQAQAVEELKAHVPEREAAALIKVIKQIQDFPEGPPKKPVEKNKESRIPSKPPQKQSTAENLLTLFQFKSNVAQSKKPPRRTKVKPVERTPGPLKK